MELLAILSTIILVGTVATLILAVASYILYKARERRGMTAPQQPQQAQHNVMTAPANGYGQHALPHGGQRYPFEQGQGAQAQQREHAQAQPPYRQAPSPRPAQAAAYVPPQHLRMQGAVQAEQWEYGVESFAPARRSGQQDALPSRSQNDDLSWLG